MMWALVIVAVLVAGVVVIVIRGRIARKNMMISVVMLRKSLRGLTESDVRSAARRLGEGELTVITLPSPDPGTTNGFAVTFPDGSALFVIDSARCYGEDTENEARDFESPQTRRAYLDHRAWVSVDLQGGAPPKEQFNKAIARMARLAAEFYDDGVTMLYAPALQRFGLPSHELEKQLRDGDLSAVFGNEDVNTPIINTEGNKKVEQAVERARREWPTFVKVWEQHGPACEGMVKGKFDVGEGAEYMWIMVSKVDAGTVSGTLANEPRDVPLKKGQNVTITHEQVADWLCMDGEKALGGYVERVLRS